MHRFYFQKPEIRGGEIVFTGPEWHHCQNVLRTKVGDRVTLFDGEGTEFLTQVREVHSQSAKLLLVQKTSVSRPSYDITLVQALPKNKIMDVIVQKATELGVREIIPVLSERSVIRGEMEELHGKVGRWQEICIESAKQCGLNWLPKLMEVKSIRDVVSLFPKDHYKFIGSLQPDAQALWNYSLSRDSIRKPVIIMIGPEGDFSPAEAGSARSAGFLPLSLGPLVLRCDTAAIYAISTLSYELRRLSQ